MAQTRNALGGAFLNPPDSNDRGNEWPNVLIS